jgi:hypothetical protein
VNAHREPARSGGMIIAGEGALATLVEFSAVGEGQRVGRDR